MAEGDNTDSFRVAGTVVSKSDGHPLAGARVLLANVKSRQKPASFTTSEDGKFEFKGVPAGKYALTGTHRGFISASYDQHDQFASAIVTGAGIDTERLLLRLAPNAIISGRILDESGEPVRSATVTLYTDNHVEGVHRINVSHGAQTDDLGNYEIPSLTPGTYFLSATAQPWYAVHPERSTPGSAMMVDPSLDVAYPVTFYPDVTDSDSATPISIHGGEHLQLDLHLNPVPSLHLVIHVPGSDPTRPVFPQLEQSVFGDAVLAQGNATRMISDGAWEITGIAAGRYNVRMVGATGGSQINGVDLNGSAQELDASTAEALSTVKVSVVRPENSGSTQFIVGLRSNNRVVPGFLRPEGEAAFENVPAGRYEVSVWAAGRRYSIAHISAEGAEISGHSVVLAPGANATLSVSIAGGSAEIQGIAKRTGKGFSGAMVVLVPRNPTGNRDLFRRDQSDLDGTFVFHGVVPGSYTVVAIEDGWDLDWSQPEIIAAYAKRGVPLDVPDKAGQDLTIPAAVEVQAK